MVEPTSAVVVKSGVRSLVTLSVVMLNQYPQSGLGVVGAKVPSVSIVTERALEAKLTLPAVSTVFGSNAVDSIRKNGYSNRILPPVAVPVPTGRSTVINRNC